MRRLLNLLNIFALSILVACTGELKSTLYEGDSGFAFAAPVLNVEAVASDNGQVVIPVFRGNEGDVPFVELSFEYDAAPEGSSESQWVPADPDGRFSLVSNTVLFADGLYKSNAYVRYGDISHLGIGKKYKFRLKLMYGLSPAEVSTVVVTVSRKLTFKHLGTCEYFDYCIFEKAYPAEIYKAEEADIYRVMDPYTAGLVAEDYASAGWLGTPDPYVQFTVDENNSIYFEPFNTGMMVNGKYTAFAYFPSEYQWGKDFSEFDTENKKISDSEFQLYAVYCLPSYQYGFLNDGAYKVTIKLVSSAE